MDKTSIEIKLKMFPWFILAIVYLPLIVAWEKIRMPFAVRNALRHAD